MKPETVIIIAVAAAVVGYWYGSNHPSLAVAQSVVRASTGG